MASEPDALLSVLKNGIYHFKRIGLEAGPLSQWLYSALGEANLPVICVETRHMQRSRASRGSCRANSAEPDLLFRPSRTAGFVTRSPQPPKRLAYAAP